MTKFTLNWSSNLKARRKVSIFEIFLSNGNEGTTSLKLVKLRMIIFNEPELIKTFINGHWLYFIGRFWGEANHCWNFINSSVWRITNLQTFLWSIELFWTV